MNTDSLTQVSGAEPVEAARDARTRARRRQLLAAAVKVLQGKGSEQMSMQSVAQEAGVSVGLIYRYFASKEEVLRSVIVGVLEDIEARVPAAILAAGPDPVDRVAAGFDAYCRVIAENSEAAVITYRESSRLSAENRKVIKDLEMASVKPLSQATQDAVDAGLFAPVDVDLFAYNLVLLAHGWALKSWYFQPQHTVDSYISGQLALVLSAALAPEHHTEYSRYLTAKED